MRLLAILLCFLTVHAWAQGSVAGNYGSGIAGNSATATAISPGTPLSTGSLTATGGTTARTLAALASDTHNVLFYGADPTGVADSAPAINAALAADGNGTYHNVYLPSQNNASYHIKSALTVNPGQCIFSDNSSQAYLTIGSDYSSSAGSPLTLTGNSFGTPCAENILMSFSQPTPIASRANFATLASGCGTGGTGCEYPAAISLTGSNNARLENVFILNAWDCVASNWVIGNGVTDINNVRCGAFDKGLNLTGSSGVVYLTNYHFYPWGISPTNQTNVYLDGNTYAAVLTNMQSLTASGFFSQNGRLSIAGSSIPSTSLFTNLEMDSDNATIEINSTSLWVTIAGGYSVGSSTGANSACELNISGAPSVMVVGHMFNPNTDSNASTLCIGGGTATITASNVGVYATAGSAVSQTGGYMIFEGNLIATGSGTWSVPVIRSTSGNYTISGNEIGGAGATGVGVSGGDASQNAVVGNSFTSGWTYAVPGTSGRYWPNAGGPEFVSSQAAPANPTGTSSLNPTYVMMGIDQTFTPALTGKVVLHFEGYCANSGTGDGVLYQLRYGTGTPPTNGAASTGSAPANSNPSAIISESANQLISCSQTQLVTGLTPGTTYWYDVSLAAATGGLATVAQLTTSAIEQP